jgi:hypothetical protein
MARFRLSPHFASMFLYDPSDVGESDARALNFFLQMQPLKYSKELIGIFHIEPNSVVSYPENSLL